MFDAHSGVRQRSRTLFDYFGVHNNNNYSGNGNTNSTSNSSKKLSYRRETRATLLVEMLFYCCTNNANKSPVSLRSTFGTYHVLTCIVLYTRRSAIMGYQCTTNLVDCHSVQVKIILIHPVQLA